MAACCERYHWTPDTVADMTPRQLQTVMTINDPEAPKAKGTNDKLGLTRELDRLSRRK